jgi:hypothetical protein
MLRPRTPGRKGLPIFEDNLPDRPGGKVRGHISCRGAAHPVAHQQKIAALRQRHVDIGAWAAQLARFQIDEDKSVLVLFAAERDVRSA